ncbi:MAG: hypothetical protein JWL71_5259, partial [Acidobacteria bacterium]|nr:hypothetical protein [Acidobacteriota bacterium]
MAGESEEAEFARGPQGAAVWSALGAASRSKADAFLDRQIALTEIQIEQLGQQEHFEHSHLRWRRFNDWMKGGLQILTLILGVAIVAGIGAVVWNASQVEGLVVDAFSVPPAFASAGVAGDVVADDLTNRIATIRDFANDNSLARSKDVSKDGDQDIKVEIPETGVSLAQAWRYLKQWLGHERRLNGNLRDSGAGRIALTVALDGRNAFILEGAAADLGKLEDQAAERVFAQVDPTNYVLYLNGKARDAESLAAAARLPRLAHTPAELADAYSLWANATRYVTGDLGLSTARARLSIAFDPKTTAGHMELMLTAAIQGHDEEALVEARQIAGKRKEDEPAWRNSDGVAYAKQQASGIRDSSSGDFQHALSQPCLYLCSVSTAALRRAEYAARLHDSLLSRALVADAVAAGSMDPVQRQRSRYFAAAAAQDWPAAVASARAYGSASHDGTAAARLRNLMAATRAAPLLAYALAQAGDFAAAHRAIDATPADCYQCLRMRGNVDALQKNRDGAQYWFARAVAAAPSLPAAYADWGTMLLAKGDAAGAGEKFAEAAKLAP